MANYPNPSGYDYSAPPPSQPYSYGVTPPPNKPSTYGGAPPPNQPHGAPRPNQPSPSPYAPVSTPYSAAPSAPPQQYPGYPPQAAPYGGPFASLVPSAFPPGTDPIVIAAFQTADRDGSGFIDDKELQQSLSAYDQSFGLRTVHLLMYNFTNTNTRKIGPKEFTQVFHSLQNWKSIFERFDRDRSGKIDAAELKDALASLGFIVSPVVLDLMVSKFDKSGGKNKGAIEYDNFIECCLTVKGLTEKFKEKDAGFTGSATFTYESFMLTILPFIVA